MSVLHIICEFIWLISNFIVQISLYEQAIKVDRFTVMFAQYLCNIMFIFYGENV